jgi:hypothetical protein
MMAMITVNYAAHAPVTITTGANVQIRIDPTYIKILHDGKTEVFPTEAVKAVVSVALPK